MILDHTSTFLRMDENQLVTLIDSAHQRLAYIASGLTLSVAESLIECSKRLSWKNMLVILDSDPEVVRFGYGTLEGLTTLHDYFEKIGQLLHHQPGIRICTLIVDGTLIIFSPTPLLIEAGSSQQFKPNALSFSHVPASLLDDLSWDDGFGWSHGSEEIKEEDILHAKRDLEANPPVQFDVSRTIRVFNNLFEFVELSLKGCALSRKKVRIPSDLLGFLKDDKTKKNFEGTYRIVQEKIAKEEAAIHAKRKEIADRWLIELPNYGIVVFRRNKDELQNEIKMLRLEVQRYQQVIEQSLQQEIDESLSTLVKSLLPSVSLNPPTRWTKFIGSNPTSKDIRPFLEEDLRKSFGSAQEWIEKMEVKVQFKAVTYEALSDPDFVRTVYTAIPSLTRTHDEFFAVPLQQKKFNY